jgi:hypothetical protein
MVIATKKMAKKECCATEKLQNPMETKMLIEKA